MSLIEEVPTGHREDWFGLERAIAKVRNIDTDIDALYGAKPMDAWDLHANLKGLSILAALKAAEVEAHLADRMVAPTDAGSVA